MLITAYYRDAAAAAGLHGGLDTYYISPNSVLREERESVKPSPCGIFAGIEILL